MKKLTDFREELSGYLEKLREANKANNSGVQKSALSDLFKTLCAEVKEIKASQSDDLFKDREMARMFNIEVPIYNNLINNTGNRGRPEYIRNISVAIKFIIKNAPIEVQKELNDLNTQIQNLQKENKNITDKLKAFEDKEKQYLNENKSLNKQIDKAESETKRNSRYRKMFLSLILLGILTSGVIYYCYFLPLGEQIKQQRSKITILVQQVNQKGNEVLDQKKRLKEFKLWSVFQPSDTDYIERFDSLINPIRTFAQDLKVGDYTNSSLKEPFPITIDSLIRKAMDLKKGNFVVNYRSDSLLYDFNEGLYSFSPDSLKRFIDSGSLKTSFPSINAQIVEEIKNKLDSIGTLEGGLSKVLNYPETNKFQPVLLYVLHFPNPNKLESARIYRYPSYLVLHDTVETAHLFDEYHHSTRTYFQDYLKKENGQAYDLKTSRKTYLSSAYLDYGKKTTMPIRTLMVEFKARDNSKYLFCIDFKLKEDE